MASTFTWLDFSDHERRQMLDVIQLFGERTTRDELGLGSVRDSFADQLFPGTSTIQTRARYFLFIPWIYCIIEEKRAPSASVSPRLRKLETEVMQALIKAGEETGLVGRRAKEKVERLPSSIYWQGLARWGIRLFPNSQDEYHRSLDIFYLQRHNRRPSRDEFEGESALAGNGWNWHPGLPLRPEGFPDQATFSLTFQEAEYLRERILSRCPESLLAHVLRERLEVEDAEFAWDLKELPPELSDLLAHGQNVSEVMHGAQILYNLMLAERRGEVERIDGYADLFDSWAARIGERQFTLQSWNRVGFWRHARRANARIPRRCEEFVDRWIDLVQDAPTVSALRKDAAVRGMVQDREVQLKRGLSRLTSPRALELWSGGSGLRQLDLRWTAAKRILSDILSGLDATFDA